MLKKDPCPCCKKDEFQIFHNKGLQRPLYEYGVYCSNRKQGCQWTGSLGHLERHLNLNSMKGGELDGCQFVSVQCSYCSKSFARSKIKVHEREECIQRPYSCTFCNEFKGTYGEVTLSHWSADCKLYPTPCPNKCGSTLQRQLLDEHITKECPKTIVECDFKHFGCNVVIERKNLRVHADENLASHVRQISEFVVRLEEENRQLKREVEFLKISTPTTALNLIMNNLERYKSRGSPWTSPSFYTHGYKLRLQVYVNDHGNDNSLCTTIFVCLVRGKFDETLKWPFQATIVVELLIDDGDRYRVLHTDRISHESQRVTNENVRFGRGVTTVHPGLMDLVKDDHLHFRIPAVQLISITNPTDSQ